LGGNGFLAIYLTGVVIGNRRLAGKPAIRSVLDSAAWGAQIAMFLILGLLAVPDRTVAAVPAGLAVAAASLLIARPLSVITTLLPLGRLRRRHALNVRELALLSWGGLKGAVPIVLALVPLMNGVEGGETILDLVLVVVLVGTLLQGLGLGPIARLLGQTAPVPPEPPLRLELSGFTPIEGSVLDVHLAKGTPAIGMGLHQLALPDHVVIAAIHRNGRLVAPRGQVLLEEGDHLFLIAAGEDDVTLPDALQRPTVR
ncbi:MAG: TrkA C-terminal domain-containing protein, partial [Trueperaceae bacterium]